MGASASTPAPAPPRKDACEVKTLNFIIPMFKPDRTEPSGGGDPEGLLGRLDFDAGESINMKTGWRFSLSSNDEDKSFTLKLDLLSRSDKFLAGFEVIKPMAQPKSVFGAFQPKPQPTTSMWYWSNGGGGEGCAIPDPILQVVLSKDAVTSSGLDRNGSLSLDLKFKLHTFADD